ncbi:MAG TPA: hypothetical protein VNO31_05375 [Umezawaea sp.]|nr:hypothetical protein [Umezawaea sp.]
MTAAHTAVITALHAAMEGPGGLNLARAPLPRQQAGHVHYPTRTITINENATVPLFCTALMHELVHLERGPSYVDEVDDDEHEVLYETARRLVPFACIPTDIRTDPYQIARHLGIDVSAVHLALNLTRYLGVA